MITRPSVRHASIDNLLRATQSDSTAPGENKATVTATTLKGATVSRSVPKADFPGKYFKL